MPKGMCTYHERIHRFEGWTDPRVVCWSRLDPNSMCSIRCFDLLCRKTFIERRSGLNQKRKSQKISLTTHHVTSIPPFFYLCTP